ncbi:hypothetical protein G9A89_010325 [Geosiphon pyriformis]|nr:hypothetical protein G9A89_010325 [Geosiphon pyriformis]
MMWSVLEEVMIQAATEMRMIKSILDWLFHKVVLDHLVVDDKMIIEPKEVKLKVNEIMEE